MDRDERYERLLARRARGQRLRPEEDAFVEGEAAIRSLPPVGRAPRGQGFAYSDGDVAPREADRAS